MLIPSNICETSFSSHWRSDKRSEQNLWNKSFTLHNPLYYNITNGYVTPGYGLEGPGIESQWGEVFYTRPDLPLGSTQPPIKWVSENSRG